VKVVVQAGAVGSSARTRVRHAELGLSEARLLGMYETMLLARALDERQWILNRQGRQPLVVSCQGHEAAQVGSASALRPGLDLMAPYYRDLAAALVFGVSARDVMLEALARATGPWTGGRQMPSHFGDPRLKILSTSSAVATQISHAVGAALASKYRGDGAVTIC
jgi:2-oxoisovalerate dehydrogenase E1 component alpha subunit